MRKFIILMLSIICITSSVHADDNTMLTLSTDAEDPCKVAVNIENAVNIYGGSLVLKYDNTVVELIDSNIGTPLENITAINNKSYADNKIKLTWASANAINYNEPILYVEFKVIDNAVAQTEIVFDEVTLYDIDSNEILHEMNNVILTLPDNNTTPPPTFKENTVSRPTDGSVSTCIVEFETNGGSTIISKTVTKNSKLIEPETPIRDGYSFMGWFTDEELTAAYEFDKPVTKDFTLYAKWAKHDEKPITSEWENPFTDVDEDDWFYSDVRFVNENMLMNGTTETTFAPNTNITRAMMVTVIYRLEGEPSVWGGLPFEDIETGSYYQYAVTWAKSNEIVKGYSETKFAPNDNITREQIAAIMHRYVQYKGYDVSVGENTNILSYDDFADVSEYAISSMKYAVGSGLIRGKTNSELKPQDLATRAEMAVLLQRLIENN